MKTLNYQNLVNEIIDKKIDTEVKRILEASDEDILRSAREEYEDWEGRIKEVRDFIDAVLELAK